MSQLTLLWVMLPIITSVMIYLIKYRMASRLMFLTQGILIGSFVYGLSQGMFETPTTLIFGGWNPLFSISFYVDQTSLIFVGLTLSMFFIIMLYAYKTYRDDHRFFFFFLFLEGVFLGLIQTNDLFNLFVFLELITVLVTILITYKKTGPSFRAGIYYLLINTLGAMFILIGIILLYYVYGTINIQVISSRMSDFSSSNIVKLAYIMMMSGISIKAAFVPLYSWLPKAHGVAQTAISALLSGLIVKVALYIFIRFEADMFKDAFYGMQPYFFYVGALTGIVGVSFALVQKDLKQILAYHTVSQMGLMMMGLSFAEGVSFYGGWLHIIHHAMFKSLLFLAAGQIILRYKTKKIHEIHGVFKTMPITAILLMIGMLSISGMPLLNGFVSKTLIKYAFKDHMMHMAIFTLINIGTVTSFVKFSSILFGPKLSVFKPLKDIKRYIAMSLLAVSSIVFGIMYEPIIEIMFGFEATQVTLFNVTYWFDYILYVFIGVIIYRFIIKKDVTWIQKIRGFSLSFEDANYALILYISVMIGVLFFMI